MKLILTLLLNCILCFISLAQDKYDFNLWHFIKPSEMINAPWNALGMVTGGTSTINDFKSTSCSGFLMDHDLVVTAAHCVTYLEEGEVKTFSPRDIYFVHAPHNQMDKIEKLKVVSVEHGKVELGHDGYQRRYQSERSYEEDWALLRLAKPIKESTPFKAYQGSDFPKEWRVAGYPVFLKVYDPVARHTICGLKKEVNLYVVKGNCGTGGGLSGAPVFVYDQDGQARVIGIHVAGIKDFPESLIYPNFVLAKGEQVILRVEKIRDLL